jgi:methionine sulfoxide reductase heme-binding subunit
MCSLRDRPSTPFVMNLTARLKQIPYTPLQIAIHVGTWGELAWIALDFFTRHLGPNPLQAIQQRTGRIAITLLVLSLACTPLSNLLGWRELPKRSRTLGLYAFMVAVIHILIFLDLDNGIAWNYFVQTIVEKPYILLGATTFLMLIPLALTSFDIWKARLGKNWKRLHQLVYLAAPVAVLHYALSLKGDLFRLQGNIVRPLIYSIVILLLLALRLPFIRRGIVSLRGRISRRVGGSHPQTRTAPAP